MFEIWRKSGISEPRLVERAPDFDSGMKIFIRLTDNVRNIQWKLPVDGAVAYREAPGGFRYWLGFNPSS
jgi:hypothetical protein